MTVIVVRGDARSLPLPDESIDLIITSPPYFGLRSYTDAGERYDGQIGSEATTTEYIDALIACTREWIRVLKLQGSMWLNLGDKYASSGGHGEGAMSQRRDRAQYQEQIGRAERNTTGYPTKSLLGLPWRYAIRCVDELGLILRAEVVQSKLNGLPESVQDRPRRSHEQWFMFTRRPRYFAAVDEIREPHAEVSVKRAAPHRANPGRRDERAYGDRMVPQTLDLTQANHPLGKLPGSVWQAPSEPLDVPERLGSDHYAAFGTEIPSRIIAGWSPSGICTACGQGRKPVVSSVGLNMSRPQARRAQALAGQAGLTEEHFAALLSVGTSDTGRAAATQSGTGRNTVEVYALADEARRVLGGYAREYLLRRPTELTYVCGCDEPTADTRPAVVLDPFGGTGTAAHVASAFGRVGVSVDRSHDYSRIAADDLMRRRRYAKVHRLAAPKDPPADMLALF